MLGWEDVLHSWGYWESKATSNYSTVAFILEGYFDDFYINNKVKYVNK